jgi:site-specific DNA recombinase
MGETFDARGVLFVAVNQQFNTTTSMGRLTLNVLLSFAQFEREVTGERIRDKIAASKRKGMWMGGVPSLGYEVRVDPLRLARANSLPVLDPVSRGTLPGPRRSPRLSLTSPSVRLKGRMPKSAENDWLPAGKRAMCVSIF